MKEGRLSRWDEESQTEVSLRCDSRLIPRLFKTLFIRAWARNLLSVGGHSAQWYKPMVEIDLTPLWGDTW